jgi:hypothetical protein
MGWTMNDGAYSERGGSTQPTSAIHLPYPHDSSTMLYIYTYKSGRQVLRFTRSAAKVTLRITPFEATVYHRLSLSVDPLPDSGIAK